MWTTVPAKTQDYCSRIVLSESYVCKVHFVRVHISNNNVKKDSGLLPDQWHKMYRELSSCFDLICQATELADYKDCLSFFWNCKIRDYAWLNDELSVYHI